MPAEKTILVQFAMGALRAPVEIQEFSELAMSAGAELVAVVEGARSRPDVKCYIGKGKVDELAALVKQHDADLVIFNHALSPSQERNLERALSCRVLDRSGLILDIFAARAQTYEGKLQVELAQLEHLSTRLIRGWTHLERQKGGIGLRGPGETQLEVDRRLIRDRIKIIKMRLEKVLRQREQNRRARHKGEHPIVALVGYTNAGKSTLFNRLTVADSYAADQLFATLDPCSRRLTVPGIGSVILVDTVGFIRDLPHELITAFRATLEETRTADLLLHVIDVSSPDYLAQMAAVNEVLKTIGAGDVPCLAVYNKIDALSTTIELAEVGPTATATTAAETASAATPAIRCSAKTGQGFAYLLETIATHLQGELIHCSLCLKPEEAKLRAKLYAIKAVEAERLDAQQRLIVTLRLPRFVYERLVPM